MPRPAALRSSVVLADITIDEFVAPHGGVELGVGIAGAHLVPAAGSERVANGVIGDTITA